MREKKLDNSIAIVSQFADAAQAEAARSTIEGMLTSAGREVEELFKSQGGIADIREVSEIYARYGFSNNYGWNHEKPLVAIEEELFWEVPQGMVLEEAQILLLALGAQMVAVRLENDDELWSHPFPPLAWLPLEEDCDFCGQEEEDEEEESPRLASSEKKILH